MTSKGTWINGRLEGFDYTYTIPNVTVKRERIIKTKEIIRKRICTFKYGNNHCGYCHKFTKCRKIEKNTCLSCYIHYRTFGHYLFIK